MAGAMQHVEGEVADAHRVALVEPAVGRHGTGLEAVGLSLFGEPLQAGIVRLVRSLDRHAELVPQLRRSARVIDMAVGQNDLLHARAALRDGIADALEIAAGIDHGGLLRLFAPQQGAVLLEGRHGYDGGADIGHDARSFVSLPADICRSALSVKLQGYEDGFY